MHRLNFLGYFYFAGVAAALTRGTGVCFSFHDFDFALCKNFAQKNKSRQGQSDQFPEIFGIFSYIGRDARPARPLRSPRRCDPTFAPIITGNLYQTALRGCRGD
jgi:hypothetical protein